MMRNVTRAALILAGVALGLMPMAGIAAADDCVALGGTLGGGECSIAAVTTAKTGMFNLDENLHIKNGGKLKVAPPGITINITGSLIMDAGSEIDGDVFTAIPGAFITVNATNDIHLLSAAPASSPPGANIHSNAVGTSCTGGNKGGTITLNADSDHNLAGNFTMDPGTTDTNGSKVSSIASCGQGEIIITGANISVDGDVLSQGTTTKGRGGPITVTAECALTVTDFGSLISLGLDPGADLVHVQGGCDVKIFGKVFSAGQGHIGGVNRCQPPNRPGHPTNSQTCVEIWAGSSLTIDSTLPHQGEVSADNGFSGGITGTGWVDLFSHGPIVIVGDSVAPFAVHANQGLNNGHGGQIVVKSEAAGVTISGLGIQASDASSGGQGGSIDVQAKLNVNLSAGKLEARGSTVGGGLQSGGQISVRSFGTGAGNGSIIGTPASTIDVTGRQVPNGIVNLTACVSFGFPPGVILPANLPAANIIKTVSCVDGAPVIPAYASPLPVCLCVGQCACLNSFSPTGAAAIAAAGQVTIQGVQLLNVTDVWFSPDCNIPASPTQKGAIKAGGTNDTINVDPLSAVLQNMHIIMVCPTGTYCSSTTIGP